MYANSETQTVNKTIPSKENFSWKEYGHYHDYFVQLLSYNQNHNYNTSNIWEFSYINVTKKGCL